MEHAATSFPPQHYLPMHTFTQYSAQHQPSAGSGLVSNNNRPNDHNPKDYSSTDARPRAKAQQKFSSLAATHPAKYRQVPPNTMLPSPPSSPSCSPDQALPLPTEMPPPQLPTPAPEAPWGVYTDPMLQTSSDPHFWGTNCTILRADRNLEPGNVISPTAMIGLPCGGEQQPLKREGATADGYYSSPQAATRHSDPVTDDTNDEPLEQSFEWLELPSNLLAESTFGSPEKGRTDKPHAVKESGILERSRDMTEHSATSSISQSAFNCPRARLEISVP
ncbi:hypothetical protein LTR37_017293 [Vermiconidia calcicola]|uniref:Uncharacterized protein n=1 Tax=Vermiconidia calcicola TaxID=1690605 RepID=A0ACC3MKG8_9PEZI|nr:hypothetical protein LTR37_017293 [Vermiconidia calcicola]